MNMEERHRYEKELRQKLEKLDPDNPVLKVIYHSTWAATDAYEVALVELRRKQK